MAENEYLDSRKIRRWQAVVNVIQNQGSDAELFDSVSDCFFKTIRQIIKEMPFSELITAINDQQKLRAILNKIKGGEDVKDFFLTASQLDVDREEKLQFFFSNALENCLYDVPWLVTDNGAEITISESRLRLKIVSSEFSSELNRLAKKLDNDPEWNPRRLKSRVPSSAKKNKTKSMLPESLLSGFRKI